MPTVPRKALCVTLSRANQVRVSLLFSRPAVANELCTPTLPIPIYEQCYTDVTQGRCGSFCKDAAVGTRKIVSVYGFISENGASVWGTNPFHWWSYADEAAIFAGIVQESHSGLMEVECVDSLTVYPSGGPHNGVTTKVLDVERSREPFANVPGAFKLTIFDKPVDVTPVPTPAPTPVPTPQPTTKMPITPNPTLEPTPEPSYPPVYDQCSVEESIGLRCGTFSKDEVVGFKKVVEVTGETRGDGRVADVWGNGTFHWNSNVAEAAVFMGIVVVGQTGHVTVESVEPLSVYHSGGPQNGVTTMRLDVATSRQTSANVPGAFTLSLFEPTAPEDVRAIVLSMDVSDTISDADLGRQVDGYIAALDRVVPRNFHGVSLGLDVFGGAAKTVFPLQLIRDQADLDRLKALLTSGKSMPRSELSGGAGTRTDDAIDLAVQSIRNSPWSESKNRAIDVSAAGPPNDGTDAKEAVTRGKEVGIEVGCTSIGASSSCNFIDGTGGSKSNSPTFENIEGTLEDTLIVTANLLAPPPRVHLTAQPAIQVLPGSDNTREDNGTTGDNTDSDDTRSGMGDGFPRGWLLASVVGGFLFCFAAVAMFVTVRSRSRSTIHREEFKPDDRDPLTSQGALPDALPDTEWPAWPRDTSEDCVTEDEH